MQVPSYARCLTPWRLVVPGLILACLLAAPGDGSAHGSLHETIEGLLEAHAEDPGDPDVLLRLAELHRLHGDFEKAMAYAERVQVGVRAAVLLARARILQEVGRDAEALETLEDFLVREPGNAEGWFLKAEILSAEGDVLQAAEACSEAIACAGDNATADQFMRGAELRNRARRPEAAIEMLRHGLARHPRHIGLREEMARLLFASGKRGEAIGELARLRGLYPSMQYRWWSMEGDLLRESEPVPARVAYQRALSHLRERYRDRPMPEPIAALQREVERKKGSQLSTTPASLSGR